MNSIEEIADRIIKGITIEGFENDADAEKVLNGQQERDACANERVRASSVIETLIDVLK